ncbi:DUF4091 domain-containing protein [Paenibacillus alkaliterrae]|uniref:DUF4091 domain-containing protein n=1 Tax=Paenibacillus alkaliterrae TaxID=320909 RepID=UPI001F1CAB8D|nr:DUF4091 domain-containing protein [Paenibacillus alkaliterrae]MCF2938023.1 DUF4091 domain-containing protein [Paenibacillus alkaliterrae]
MVTKLPPIFETRCISSLSKVFADTELQDSAVREGTALWKETYSFQVAYRSSKLIKPLQIKADSPLLPYLSIRTVGLSPSELPVYDNPDSGYMRTAPGLYPDPLYPLSEGLRAVPGQWRSVWVTVSLPSKADFDSAIIGPSSLFTIDLQFSDATGNLLGEERFTLEVMPAELPEQKLLHTEWFHCDCIATHYGCEVFSEEHWQLIDRYIRNAADHGVNMLLTPLFTPPLDTAVGGERLTVQLVGLEQTGDNQYRFDFSRLERWVAMCKELGIRYFEFSHLFTQWGAQHAPKIIATVEGAEKRIFGWETEAAGEPYRQFLDQFLPELVRFIRSRGLEKQVYFHVSDEPAGHQLDSYKQASDILKSHLSDFAFLEALSDYEFYEHGLVPIPIPSNDHIEPFLENGVEPLWTYYCCGQHREVSNRFFSMPSSRNRVLGVQLYKFGIQGFLHWGYNFWYSQYATRTIDPFRVTDADCAFASGDPFVVYPGQDGPIDSIRWEVFREALQDLRALELFESLAGRSKAMALLEEDLKDGLTFKTYPSDPGWLLHTRERINQAIKAVSVIGRGEDMDTSE